jgi:septum site-determining protein MinC
MIDGLVQCDGEYMVMCGISPRGHVIFNGEIVERLHVKEGILQKIVMREGLLELKDVV